MFADRLSEYLRYCYYMEGKPEAVKVFITNRDFAQVRVVQEDLLAGHRGDFNKPAPAEHLPRMGMI